MLREECAPTPFHFLSKLITETNIGEITRSISDLEQELNELLRVELDRLILVFKQTDPAFFHSYSSARITIDYGGGRGSREDESLNPAV